MTDSSGAVIPNATVSAILDGITEPSATTRTDQNGFYAFIVKSGHYELEAIAPGFEKATKSVLLKGTSVEIPPTVLSVVGVCGSSAVPVRGRVSPDDSRPPDVSVCDLMTYPGRFSGRIVRVRGRILIAFEEFELDYAHCGENPTTEVWLEYGRGPKRQPTIWCCGNIAPRDSLRVIQNKEFLSFNHYLSDQFRTKGCLGRVCSPYEVTATLTGRFDTQVVGCSDGESHCPYGGGFGHFGLFCSRLVIESVSDVAATPAGGR